MLFSEFSFFIIIIWPYESSLAVSVYCKSALHATFGSILLVWQNVAKLWLLGVVLLSSLGLEALFWPPASSVIHAYCITPESGNEFEK